MQGLMSSYPLTLPMLFHRAERLFGDKTLTTLTATGKARTTYAEWAAGTRRLAGALEHDRGAGRPRQVLLEAAERRRRRLPHVHSPIS